MSGFIPATSQSLNFCQSPVHVNPGNFMVAEAVKIHGSPLPEDVKATLRASFQCWRGFYKRAQKVFFRDFTDLKSIKFKVIGGRNGASN